MIEPLVARLLFGKGLHGLFDQLACFLQAGRVIFGTEIRFHSRVDRRVLNLLKEGTLGVFGDELVVVDRGGFVVMMLHVIIRDLDCGIVGQRSPVGSLWRTCSRALRAYPDVSMIGKPPSNRLYQGSNLSLGALGSY